MLEGEDMEANIITLARIVLVFVGIGLFSFGFYFDLVAAILVVIIIYMDALDGIVARRLNIASKLGALLDITGDRIVENAYWIYFATIGLVSYWVPLVVITRSFVIDSLRSLAFSKGKTAFGKETMMRTPIMRFLTASRLSRAVYGTSKAVIFAYLAGIVVLESAQGQFGMDLPEALMTAVYGIKEVLVYIVVIMCVVRGIPVVYDGWPMLVEKQFERIAEMN
jgi:CDP-diacylglycerol--glycerol-3-phosphate 3-phosphatidyltransferase